MRSFARTRGLNPRSRCGRAGHRSTAESTCHVASPTVTTLLSSHVQRVFCSEPHATVAQPGLERQRAGHLFLAKSRGLVRPGYPRVPARRRPGSHSARCERPSPGPRRACCGRGPSARSRGRLALASAGQSGRDVSVGRDDFGSSAAKACRERRARPRLSDSGSWRCPNYGSFSGTFGESSRGRVLPSFGL
jgi:hypothetical protein